MRGKHTKNWKFGLSTHKGPVKKQNEDFGIITVLDLPDGECLLAIVADGMGGYEVGDQASRMAVSLLRNKFKKLITNDVKPLLCKFEKKLRGVFKEINQELVNYFQTKGMTAGTTLSMLVIYNNEFLIGHVGDSRIYQLKDVHHEAKKKETKTNSLPQNEFLTEPIPDEQLVSSIIQLTKDHSWVAREMELGNLTKESARLHPKRNVLLQCLGIKHTVEPYIISGIFPKGDRFLLASDGYHSLFSDQGIQEMVQSRVDAGMEIQEIADNLVYSAYHSGATDNITVLLIQT